MQRTIIKLCNQQITNDRINRVKNLTLESEREGSFVFGYRGELDASLNRFSELTHENMLGLNILKKELHKSRDRGTELSGVQRVALNILET